jgi:hypothetical protein
MIFCLSFIVHTPHITNFMIIQLLHPSKTSTQFHIFFDEERMSQQSCQIFSNRFIFFISKESMLLKGGRFILSVVCFVINMFRFVLLNCPVKTLPFQTSVNPCFRSLTKKPHILQPSFFLLRGNSLRFIFVPPKKDDLPSPQVEIVDPKSILFFCLFWF